MQGNGLTGGCRIAIITSLGIAILLAVADWSVLLIVCVPPMRPVRGFTSMAWIEYIGAVHAVAMPYFFGRYFFGKATSAAASSHTLIVLCCLGAALTALHQLGAQLIMAGLGRLWYVMTETLNGGIIGVIFYAGWAFYFISRNGKNSHHSTERM